MGWGERLSLCGEELSQVMTIAALRLPLLRRGSEHARTGLGACSVAPGPSVSAPVPLDGLRPLHLDSGPGERIWRGREEMEPRQRNLLVTGTPGVGKSTLAQRLAEMLSMEYIDVGSFARENDYTDGYDEERQCAIIDEDKVLDALEDKMVAGNVILDYHSPEWFPERWFGVVILPRCCNDLLYERLAARGYSEAKIQENVECEIMQVVRDSARELYPNAILIEEKHEAEADTDRIVQRVRMELYGHANGNGPAKIM